MSGDSLARDERDARKRTPIRYSKPPITTRASRYYWWEVAGEQWLSLRAAETIVACERGLEHIRRAGM